MVTLRSLPGLRPLVQGFITRTFGPPPFNPEVDPGDPGLTGPGSASWRVLADPVAIAGGFRALLLQVAHPHAMAGVFDHSSFRTDPLDRLRRTSAYVTTSTFGSTREALEVARRVRSTHPRVTGTAPDGMPYRADDPHLLTWVGIALTASFLAAHEEWAPEPLTAAEADQFVREQSAISALLDPRVDLEELAAIADDPAAVRDRLEHLPMMTEGRLPHTSEELAQVLAGYDDELEVNHQGREALRFLRWPPVPAAIKAGYLAVYAGAAASLTPHQRRALEIRMPAPAAAAAKFETGLVLAAIRRGLGSPPPSIAAATARVEGVHAT